VPKHLNVMRTVLLIVAGLVVGAAAVLVIRGSADDDSGSPEKAIRDVERQTTGAYDCMPRDVRRQFDVALKRFDARFGAVIDRLPDDTDPQEADRALRADPQVARLRAKARSILVDYVPGGDRFDPACYERATKRYDRKVARRGAR
jgi:hypothetical protein